MQEETGKLETSLAGLREPIEARIRQLIRTRTEAVRASIERSIAKLEAQRKEAEERRALLLYSKEELENLASAERDLFSEYRRRIREVLGKAGKDLKSRLATLLSALILEENGIKTALTGVHHSGLRSTVLAVAPPVGRTSNFLLQP